MSSNDGKKRVALALGACAFAGTLLYFVVGGIGNNLVYYWGPTEVLAAGPKAKGASIRLGGLVEPGSIKQGQGSNMSFTVTDGKKSFPVRCTSVPPQMFREGIGVAVNRGVMLTMGASVAVGAIAASPPPVVPPHPATKSISTKKSKDI